MERRQEQEREQELRSEQEHVRWREDWLRHLRRQAERSEKQAEAVLAKRRAEAWESSRRRQELERRHCQSLENLTALIRGREERAAQGLAEQRDRRSGELAERLRRERQLQLLTAQQRQQLEAAEEEERHKLQQDLQRRMTETERRRIDRETAKTQHVSSANASWAALSAERLQRLDELAERRSRLVWQELSRRTESAASNQRRLAQLRRAAATNKSAAEGERRRQVRAARQQAERSAAGRGHEAATRLRDDLARAERAARQRTATRQEAVTRENLHRQTRHRDAVRHIRQLEDQQAAEARYRLKMEDRRVNEFLRQREMAILSSRRLANLAANLRQTVRQGDRSAEFDKMAAHCELECRVLYGPGPSCHPLYRPRSASHLI